MVDLVFYNIRWSHTPWKYCILGYMNDSCVAREWYFVKLSASNVVPFLCMMWYCCWSHRSRIPVISSVNSFGSSKDDFSLSDPLCSCVVAVDWHGVRLWVSKCFQCCEWETSRLALDEQCHIFRFRCGGTYRGGDLFAWYIDNIQ